MSAPALSPKAHVPNNAHPGSIRNVRSHSEKKTLRTTVAAMSERSPSTQSRWLELDNERRALLQTWGQQSSDLISEERSLSSTRGQFEDGADTRQLSEIDARLHVLNKLRLRLLVKLPKRQAKTLHEIIENVAVAARLVAREDNPHGHDIIVRALRDLRTLASSP